MKYLLTFLLFCAPIAVSAQNCSNITGTLTQVQQVRSAAGTVTTQINTYNVVCRNTVTNVNYYTQNNAVTGQGSEASNGSIMVKCNAGPFSTHVYLPSIGGTGNNSFTSYGHNNAFYRSTSGSVLCYDNGYQTTTTLCPSKTCGACTGCLSGTATKDANGERRYATCSAGSCTSPIVVDVTGQGFSLTSASDGVKFDIRGVGTPQQVSWTEPRSGNGFLALPGADGQVHSGKQLFGNFTAQPPSEAPNGFAALAVYDLVENGGNLDGVVDPRDAIYGSLRIWTDANQDGISQPEELRTLPSLGIASINLKYVENRKTDQYGNVFRYKGSINASGPDRKIYDVFLVLCE
jgi:hypothetical protein